MKPIIRIVSLLLFVHTSKITAQLSGTFTIPGTYSTIAAAINDLNTQGVSGTVTMLVSAGHTETVPVGGYSLTATGTATSPIIFQKSGAGANPLVTAYAGGVATPTSALQDGIWRLIGCDYVTIDGIDLLDPNVANPATMEFGYGLFKASAVNGCQNNTIKNCVITLNRVNNAAGSGPAVEGSRGIDMVNALSSAHTTSLIITAITGANSNNKFYSNTIQNCNVGISAIGYLSTYPTFLYTDSNNEIGGNSMLLGNTIINFGGGGSVRPSAGIQTVAQYSLNILYNAINSNTGSGVNHPANLRGISMNNAGLANASINNNTVTVHSGAITSLLYGIEVVSSGYTFDNVSITNNLIANCTYTGSTTGNFRGITAGGCLTLSISGNSVLNNSTSATGGFFAGIWGIPGYIGTFSNNVIDLGIFSANSTSLTLYGIFIDGSITSATVNILSNTFQNANFTGIIGGTGLTSIIRHYSNISSLNIIGNNFNNISLKSAGTTHLIHDDTESTNTNVSNNFISSGFSQTAAGGSFVGYFLGRNSGGIYGTSSFSGNNFSNITLAGATTFYGSLHTVPYDQAVAINNNTISNVSTGGGGMYGIYHNFGTSASFIQSNLISNLSGGIGFWGILTYGSPMYSLAVSQNTITSFSSSVALSGYGIYLGGGSLINVSQNKISNISSNSFTSALYGIYQNTVTTLSLWNNLIGDLRADFASTNNAVSGVYLNGGTSIDMAHNTIYLAAPNGGANFGSSALYSSTTPSLNLRNNILINNSISNGTGKTIAFYRNSPSLATYSLTSNNNILFAGAVPSLSNCIYFDGVTTYSTISNFTTLVSPRDIFSYTENTAFTSTVGSNNGFLHISNSPASLAESNGVSISGINVDVDGQVRFGNIGYIGSGVGVDIGADEYNGTFIDVLAPIITHTNLGTTCSTGNRTLTATITDNSGVPITGSFVPTVYYKKNAGAYISSAGVLAAGTASNGVWNFTINSAALGGLAVSDVISYYIIAQDTYSTINVGSSPPAGLIAASVVSVTNHPTSPNIYTITSLAGTYSVGTGGTFTTLTAAANAYNTSCLNGPVTFVLTDPSYSGNETFPIVFQNNPFASPANSLNIRPAAGITAAISPTLSSTPSVFKFLDARYITLDGLNSGGSAINVSNSNSTTATAGVWLASNNLGCNNIAIKNLTLTGGSNTVTTSCGIIAGTNSTIPVTAAGADNDNITIQGVSISRYYNGILALGTSTTLLGAINNWTISNNQIGPVTSNTLNNLGLNGMSFQNALSLSITGNTVSNVISSAGYLYGINLGVGVLSSTLNANKIVSIKYTGIAGFGGIGLDVQTGSSSSNLLIQNNMISDISGDGSNAFTNGAYAGVRLGSANATGGVKFFNNTIAMNQSNTINGSSNANITACMYLASTSNSIELVNNLLYSDIQFTNTAARTFAIYSAASASALTNMNYNNYYVTGPQGVLAQLVTTTLNTLPLLQSAFGNNGASQNVAPVFISNTDVHLNTLSNFFLDNLGTIISGVNTDIDGQFRSLTLPDIGADEFTTPNCSTVSAVSVFTPTSYSICASQSVTLSRSSYTFLPGIQQQWQISNTPGGPYTVIPSANGVLYNTPTLTPGNYYYVVANTCTFTNQTAVSNEATVSVYPYPVVSVSPISTTVCAGGTPTVLTASGASSYTWSPNFGLSVINGSVVNASPTLTTLYTVTGSNPGGCTGNANTATVLVNVIPAAGGITVSATPTLVCQGSSSNLQVTSTSSVYAVTSIPFSPISTPTSGVGTLCSNGNVITPMSSGFLDDGDWYVLPIPFTFTFFAAPYTGCAVSTNGFLTLGSVVPPTFNGYGVPLPSFAAGRPCVGGVYGNLTFANTGTINSFTSGSAPNRKFVVNWSNGQYSIGNTGTITTQTILYETTNIIEVHTTRNTGQYPAVEGIQNGNGSVAYVVAGRNSQNFNITNDAYRWEPVITYSWIPSTYLNSPSISNPVASNIQNNITYTAIAQAANGCVLRATASISVIPSPTISISANITTVCAGSQVNLSASGANTYTWSTGAFTPSVSVNPVITTTYNVSGTGTLNNCATTVTQVITVVPLPTLSISGNSVICVGQSASLSVAGANTYSWSNGSTNSNINVSPITNTSYSVTGTSSVGACTGTTALTLTVYPNPTITVSGNTVICSGQNASLSANGANTYSWSDGSNTQVVFPSPQVTTIYSVTGTNNLGGCTGNAVLTLSVNASPTISISGGTVICAGQSASLSATGANTYTWSNATVASSIAVTPAATTIYSVTGTNTFNACQSTTSEVITVVPLPLVNISGTTAICLGQTVNLTAGGASSYSWSNGVNSSIISVFPTSNTTYSVVGVTGPGCSGSAALTLTVHPLPAATVSASPSATVCEGETVQLSALGDGSNNYLWEDGSTGTSVTVSPLSSSVYTLQIGNNVTGCVAKKTFNLTVDPCTSVDKQLKQTHITIYPNPFNSQFYIETDSEEQKSFEVYDISGRIVFIGKIKKGKNQVDMEEFAKGVYYLRVISTYPVITKIINN